MRLGSARGVAEVSDGLRVVGFEDGEEGRCVGPVGRGEPKPGDEATVGEEVGLRFGVERAAKLGDATDDADDGVEAELKDATLGGFEERCDDFDVRLGDGVEIGGCDAGERFDRVRDGVDVGFR